MSFTKYLSFLLAFAASWLPRPAESATLRVPVDHPSLLSAVDAAADGDSILVGPGVWSHREDRVISYGGGSLTITSCAFITGKSITIVGEMGADATVIDGGLTSPHLIHVISARHFVGKQITLDGLTVTGANARGLALVNGQMVTIKNCKFRNNVFLPGLGRVIESIGPHLQIHDCDLRENSGAGEVVGISAGNYLFEANNFEMTRTTIVGHSHGGATFGGTYGGSRIIRDCAFIGNRGGDGAGLGAGGPLSTVIVERNLFLANVATGVPSGIGGGGLATGGSSVTVRFNTFAYDSTIGFTVGGALIINGGFAEVSNNTFYKCHANLPGSAVAIGGDVSVQFLNNVVVESSGGQALHSGTLTSVVNGGCNLLWQNAGGNYSGPWDPLPGDLVADPLFCDPSGLEFTVSASSPCVAGNLPGCGAIGAWGIGCGTVSIVESSWGAIKALYR